MKEEDKFFLKGILVWQMPLVLQECRKCKSAALYRDIEKILLQLVNLS
jgi:hypothetical protein